MNEKRRQSGKDAEGRPTRAPWAERELAKLRRRRSGLCPETGGEHELDDGRCLHCNFDVEFTP